MLVFIICERCIVNWINITVKQRANNNNLIRVFFPVNLRGKWYFYRKNNRFGGSRKHALLPLRKQTHTHTHSPRRYLLRARLTGWIMFGQLMGALFPFLKFWRNRVKTAAEIELPGTRHGANKYVSHGGRSIGWTGPFGRVHNVKCTAGEWDAHVRAEDKLLRSSAI